MDRRRLSVEVWWRNRALRQVSDLGLAMLRGVQQDAPEWRLPMTGTTSAGTVRLADDLVLTRIGFGAFWW
jgi:hypothetical protein